MPPPEITKTRNQRQILSVGPSFLNNTKFLRQKLRNQRLEKKFPLSIIDCVCMAPPFQKSSVRHYSKYLISTFQQQLEKWISLLDWLI